MSLYADDPDLMGPPSIYAVCSKCSTQKRREEVRGGYAMTAGGQP